MQKIVNFRPVVFSGVSIAAGIIFASLIVFKSALWSLIPITVGAAATIAVYFIKRKISALVFGGICVVLFAAGALAVSVSYSAYGGLKDELNGAAFEGTVRSIVSFDEETGSTFVLLDDVSSESFDIGRGRILVGIRGECELGDRYYFKGDLRKIDLSSIDLFYFPERIFYELTSSTIAENVTAETDFFYKVRSGIRSILKNNLSKRAYSFCVAMVLGSAETLPEDVRTNFGAAGVSHVFAVSGLHVTFFAAVISFLLALIKIKRLKKDVIVLILTLLYSGVCGFPVSSLRAVVTFFVFGVARSLGFKRDGLSVIFFSLTIVLLLMPTSIFTLGFILSFSAVIGIAVLGTSFKDLFGFMPSALSSAFAVALSAFLATAPVIAKVMGRVSVVTVLANVVVVPIVTVLFYVTLVLIALVAIVPVFGGSFILSEALVDFIVGITEKIDFGRFLIFGHASDFILIYYYSMLLIACEKVNLPKPVKTAAAIAAPVSLILFV